MIMIINFLYSQIEMFCLNQLFSQVTIQDLITKRFKIYDRGIILLILLSNGLASLNMIK